MDGRKGAAAVFGIALTAAVLAVPIDDERSGIGGVVKENRSVVIDPATEVSLGMPVAELGPDFNYDAYDPDTRSGLVQWIGPDGASVILDVSGGVVRAISVAFDEGFRTTRGVGVGDPAWRLDRTYGSSLEQGNTLHTGEAFTSFDTACTGNVNAIGLALGAEGLGALRTFWSADESDACTAF